MCFCACVCVCRKTLQCNRTSFLKTDHCIFCNQYFMQLQSPQMGKQIASGFCKATVIWSTQIMASFCTFPNCKVIWYAFLIVQNQKVERNENSESSLLICFLSIFSVNMCTKQSSKIAPMIPTLWGYFCDYVVLQGKRDFIEAIKLLISWPSDTEIIQKGLT